jgi:transposase InsO family protein
MKELGLKSVTRKKKRYIKSKEEPYAIFPDLLKQNFTSDGRGKKWCIDFTYTYFNGGKKRYNCTVIDLYSREVVASVNGSRITAELAKSAVNAAIKRCGKCEDLLLHSDRGSQFTSKSFVEFCKENGITQSMSKPGCPYDNAPMERYFNTLKTELLYLHEYETEEALYTEITKNAYGYYNNQRPHSFNGGLAPRKVT